jgi:hypothetical protein
MIDVAFSSEDFAFTAYEVLGNPYMCCNDERPHSMMRRPLRVSFMNGDVS